MSDELRDAAFRAWVWGTIETRAKQLKDDARGELSSLPVGETVAARWGDRLLAKASMAKGKAKLVVTSEAALLAWVKEHHPTEIIESVNPAFMKTFGMVGDQAHWQGEPVEFMRVDTSEPVVSVRKEKDLDALAIVAEIMSSGQLQFDPPKEITQ